MADRTTARISARKAPRQARSSDLVRAILEAATRILAEEGAARFTTARVAERAGVSIGSLYQYFPNKAAILFRLQSDEWGETTTLLRRILEDESQPPPARLRALVHAFLRSECAEAGLRVALTDAAPLYRDAPEAETLRATGRETFQRFFAVVLPEASAETRARACDLIRRTLSATAKDFSETPHDAAEVDAFAEAMADMFAAYLAGLVPAPQRTKLPKAPARPYKAGHERDPEA